MYIFSVVIIHINCNYIKSVDIRGYYHTDLSLLNKPAGILTFSSVVYWMHLNIKIGRGNVCNYPDLSIRRPLCKGVGRTPESYFWRRGLGTHSFMKEEIMTNID